MDEWEGEEIGDLGVPTDEQMLRQHLQLLESEYHECADLLRKARRNIRRLVEQQQRVNEDRSRLRIQVEELTRRVDWLQEWIKAHPERYEPFAPTWGMHGPKDESVPAPTPYDPMK